MNTDTGVSPANKSFHFVIDCQLSVVDEVTSYLNLLCKKFFFQKTFKKNNEHGGKCMQSFSDRILPVWQRLLEAKH